MGRPDIWTGEGPEKSGLLHFGFYSPMQPGRWRVAIHDEGAGTCRVEFAPVGVRGLNWAKVFALEISHDDLRQLGKLALGVLPGPSGAAAGLLNRPVVKV